jgi:hypothetical protein
MVMAAMPLHTMVVMLGLTTAGIDRLITLRHIMVRGASFGQHMLTMGLATAGMAIAGDRHKLRIAVENAVDRHGVFFVRINGSRPLTEPSSETLLSLEGAQQPFPTLASSRRLRRCQQHDDKRRRLLRTHP